MTEQLSVDEVFAAYDKNRDVWESATTRTEYLALRNAAREQVIAAVRAETLAELRTAESNYDKIAAVLDAGGQFDQLQAEKEAAEARAARLYAALEDCAMGLAIFGVEIPTNGGGEVARAVARARAALAAEGESDA